MTKKELDVNDELIIKYLAGEAKPEEALALMYWLENEKNSRLFEEIRTVYQFTQTGDPSAGINKDLAWQNIKNRTTLEAPKRVWYFQRLGTSFAALSLIVIISFSIIYFFKGGSEGNYIKLEAQQPVEKVQLPDGSTLSMLGLSAIIYEEKFGEDHRGLNLESGEVYFEVADNRRHPFIIKTPLGEVEVLGTSFNVRLENDLLEVAVERGRVKLTSRKKQFLTIEKGQTGRIFNEELSLQNQLDINPFAYATGRLRFEESSIREVVQIMEKTYGVKIAVSKETIMNCHLTGTFDGISIENLVTLIGETLNLSVVKNEEGFILEGEGC